MAKLTAKNIRTFKQQFVDAGMSDADTTMSDLVSLVDEVLLGQSEIDHRFLRVRDALRQLEVSKGESFTSRQSAGGL